MIVVHEDKNGKFTQVSTGMITSLDGERQAAVQTILHDSWTAEERAAFGIYTFESPVAPEGEYIDDIKFKNNKGVVSLVVKTKDVSTRIKPPKES